MFEKLKEYGLYVVLGLIALGALAYAYVQTSNSQKGAELHQASLDAMVANMSKSDKLKKSSTVADNLLEINGGKTIGQYKIDDEQVSYVIGETYDDIFNNKRTIDIASEFDDVEEGKLRTILIAQPATQVNGEDINVIGLNSDKSITIGENTITKENLSGVDNELKGYNISAIGYGLFENEQSAKDFRDTYFSSYEIYEVGTTGKFIILNEYNTTGGGESLGTKINSSTTGATTAVGGGETENEYLALDTNGVTVKAKEGTVCGNEYELAGQIYYVACNKSDLLEKLYSEDANAYAANRIITTKVTDMSELFVPKVYGYGGYADQRGRDNLGRKLIYFLNQYEEGYTKELFYGYGLNGFKQNDFWGSDYYQNNKLTFTENTQSYKNSEIFSQVLTTEAGNTYGFTYNFNMKYLKNIDISNWDTSNVTNMSFMFFANSVFNGNISNWDVSNVTNMEYMFSHSDFNQDISNWNVNNVTNMEGMFSRDRYFNQNLGNWNVDNVTNMKNMFGIDGIRYRGGVTMQNIVYTTFNNGGSDSIGNWNTGNVTDMDGMFANNHSFNQDISGWNTGNVTNMSSMFSRCNLFNQNLSGWNTSNIEEYRGFDYEASSWESSNKPHFN